MAPDTDTQPGTGQGQRMRVVRQPRYGPADVLELTHADRPLAGPDEVLVRVRAAGVDPAVWHLLAGQPYLVRLMGFGLRAPKAPVPGTDVAGRVEAVGPGVSGIAPGDEVFGSCRGAFAEYAVLRKDHCIARPAHLSAEQAAAVATSATTALQALRDRGRVQAGQHVLVIGAGGGVGTYAVQLAKVLGAAVTGVCSASKAELVRGLGADHVVDYARADALDGSTRYDLILDTAGNRPLRNLRRALQPAGTLVIVGGEGGNRWFGGLGRNLHAAACSPFTGQRLLSMFATVRGEDLRYLAGLLDAGSLTPVVDRTYPLAEAAEAVRYVHRGHAAGKVVLTV